MFAICLEAAHERAVMRSARYEIRLESARATGSRAQMALVPTGAGSWRSRERARRWAAAV